MATTSASVTDRITNVVQSEHHDVLEITKPGLLLESPAPTVVMMGWVGCRMRYLRKYAQVYADMGFNTVCGICPTSHVFTGFTGPVTDYARFVLHTLMADKALHRGGVVFNPFSNGGVIPFRFMVELLNTEPEFEALRRNVTAVVFDSSPCYMALVAGSKALCHSLGVQNPILRGLVFVAFSLYSIGIAPWSRNTPSAFWNDMRTWELMPHVQEFYVTSETDVLLDYPALEALVRERQQRRAPQASHGGKVELVMFPGSPHVEHLRSDPAKYKAVVRQVWGHNKHVMQQEQEARQQVRACSMSGNNNQEQP